MAMLPQLAHKLMYNFQYDIRKIGIQALIEDP